MNTQFYEFLSIYFYVGTRDFRHLVSLNKSPGAVYHQDRTTSGVNARAPPDGYTYTDAQRGRALPTGGRGRHESHGGGGRHSHVDGQHVLPWVDGD